MDFMIVNQTAYQLFVPPHYDSYATLSTEKDCFYMSWGSATFKLGTGSSRQVWRQQETHCTLKVGITLFVDLKGIIWPLTNDTQVQSFGKWHSEKILLKTSVTTLKLQSLTPKLEHVFWSFTLSPEWSKNPHFGTSSGSTFPGSFWSPQISTLYPIKIDIWQLILKELVSVNN